MAETEHKRKTPRDLLRMGFRRWRLFLLSASLFAVATLLIAQRIPLKYTGEAKFQRTSDVAAADEKGITQGIVEARRLTLELELIGREAMQQAAEDEGLTKGLEHDLKNGQLTDAGVTARQDLVKGLMAATRVGWDARSDQLDQVTVTFEHRDPYLAMRMPNTLVSNYINRTGEKTKQSLVDSGKFLREQMDKSTTLLDAQIQKRREFEDQHQDVRPQEPDYLRQQIQQCERDLDRAAAQKTAAETKLALLGILMTPRATTGPATTQPDVVVFNPKLAKLKDELQAARDDLQTAQKILKMTTEHPTVKGLNLRITMLEERMQEANSQSTTRPAHAVAWGPGVADNRDYDIRAARMEIDQEANEVTRLRLRKAELVDLQGQLVPVRAEFSKLLEKERELENEKTSWQRRESDVRMALAAELKDRRNHLSAVQAAQRQSRPSSPSLMMILGFAIVGGLAFGAALLFLLQMLDRSIATTEEASHHFGLPIQGVVEEIVPARQRARRRLRKWTLTPAVVGVVTAAMAVAGMNIKVWLLDAEAFRQWRKSAEDSMPNRVRYFLGMAPPPAPAEPSASAKSRPSVPGSEPAKSPSTTAPGSATKLATTAPTTSRAGSAPSTQPTSGGPSSTPATASQPATASESLPALTPDPNAPPAPKGT